MVEKGKKFSWIPETQQAFEQLKPALTSQPVLAMPIDDGEFVLDTDASDFAIGAVLWEGMREWWRMLADLWIKEKPSSVTHARIYWLLCILCVISGSICWVESLRYVLITQPSPG